MGFSITPAQPGVPQHAAGPFPRYIQFRFNGVDLGGPDATVVDFVGDGWIVTRGAGEDANKITVSLDGAGSAILGALALDGGALSLDTQPLGLV